MGNVEKHGSLCETDDSYRLMTSTLIRDLLMRIRHIVTALERVIPVLEGRGLTLTSAHVRVRDVPSIPPIDKKNMFRRKFVPALVLSCSHLMCVSAKGLGRLL